MKHLFRFLIVLPLFAYSQESGIHFEHGLSWKAIQAKAKAENKYIFMDCYTTWCGPCKYMSNVIFPQKIAGDFFNKHFINVKVQLDTTANDNSEIITWYKDARDIADKYEVRAYPTFLFFNAEGNAVHKIVGGGEAEEFVNKSKAALTPESQYYTLLNKYKNGEKEPSLLYNFAKASLEAYEVESAAEAADAYLATQNNLYTKDNLLFLSMFTKTSSDKGFKVMLDEPARVNAVLGEGIAENVVLEIIMKEDVYPNIFAMYSMVQSPQDLPEPDWSHLETALNKKYPSKSAEIISYSKVIFYLNKTDWQNFAQAVQNYIKTYGANVSPVQLNSFAWSVFENCDDITYVTAALEWSRRSFAKEENPVYIDTYANLLHKLGKTEEAIEWEEKALSLADEASKGAYSETLQKMKRGEKTWH